VPSKRIELKATADSNTAFRIYQSGGADVATGLPEVAGPKLLELHQAGKRPDLHIFPVHGTYYYRFNCKQPPLDNVKVRQALASCVDRERIVAKITARGERATRSFVTPGLFTEAAGRRIEYVPSKGPAYDPARARRLLAEAGYPGGKGFPDMAVLFNDSPGHKPIAEFITNVWRRELGIEVGLDQQISKIFGQRLKEHKFHLCRSGWFTDYADPTGYLGMFHSGDGNNDGQFDVPAYDALLEQAAAEADPARRYDLLARAERLLVADHAGIIPIYQYVGQLMFRDNIGGIFENPKSQILLKHVFKR